MVNVADKWNLSLKETEELLDKLFGKDKDTYYEKADFYGTTYYVFIEDKVHYIDRNTGEKGILSIASFMDFLTKKYGQTGGILENLFGNILKVGYNVDRFLYKIRVGLYRKLK
jgi:hypothetical protein